MQFGVQVLVSESGQGKASASVVRQFPATDDELLRIIFQRCRSRIIDLPSLRASGVPATACDAPRFRRVMQNAADGGLGDLLTSGGGRSGGQPKRVFRKAMFEQQNAALLSGLQRWNLDPLLFV